MNLAARVTVFLAIAAAGCSSSPSQLPGEETVWGDTNVLEELRIGMDRGPDEYRLGEVCGMAVGADGTIYVCDRPPRSIRIYAADGSFIGRAGGPGQGPGEYQSPPAPRVLSDGRLAVWDARNRRISFFSHDGEYQSSVRADGSFGGSGTFQVDRDDNLYVKARSGRDGVVEDELRKYSLDGQRLGAIPLPGEDPSGRSFVLAYEGYVRPFTVMTLFAWNPAGFLAVGRNDRYDVELRKPSGSVHLTRALDPIRLEAEELEEWNAFRDRSEQRSRDRGSKFLPGPIPAQKPFFREIHGAEDGRTWVFRYVRAEERADVEPIPGDPDRPLLTWREPPTYDVFETDGSFLGTVVLPVGFRPYVFRAMHVWGASMDDAGVERVLRLRVVPEG